MRGSPAVLGGFSALLGLLIILALFLFIETALLVQSVLPGLLLGLAGAWELWKHRKAGSLAFLVGGLFPPVSYFLLATAPDYGSLLFDFLILEWWSPLLILAGVLGILNLPSKQPSPENIEERSEDDYMRSANCSPRRSAAARRTVLTAMTRPALWRFRSSSDRCEMSDFS